MKRFSLMGLLLAALAVPGALFAQVETSAGTIAIGGKIKLIYMNQAEDADAIGSGRTGTAPANSQRYGFDGSGFASFTTANVEVDVSGTLGANVVYLIQLQASLFGTPQGNTPGMGGASSQGELNGSAVGVRQALIGVVDLIPSTSVYLGTGNLPIGTYQSRETNDWDLISLPLMNVMRLNDSPALNTGRAYAPMGLGWQATGVMLAVKPIDALELDLAYFNGYANANANVDAPPDLEKSWMVRLALTPVEGSVIAVAYLNEGWQEDLNNVGDASTEQQHAEVWVVNAAFATDTVEFTADYMTSVAKDYAFDKKGRPDDLLSVGWQATLGLWLTDSVEVLVRYDYLDPDNSNAKRDVDGPLGPVPYDKTNKFDGLNAITIGMNYLINYNAELAVNYMFITEQGAEIDMRRDANSAGGPGTTKYYAGSERGKRQVLDNDTLLVQLQVWQ